ncbi:MAG: trypsin-like peptidase domain-containing protein [Planctomycetes bacterium]|nr:trypsin-like peptidase domain-containing protein [Planctomycetota bacterium]
MRKLTPLLLPIATLSFAASAQAQDNPLIERNSPLQVVEPNEDDRALRMTPVVRAVQRAADSVVSIYLQNQLARRQPVTEGQGSGVLLDDSGLVITNWHVIAPVLLGERRGRSYGVLVKLRDGRERPARLLSSTPTRDLALLQLELQGDERVEPIEIGRSSDLMIGETVIAIGNPQGHANTVTSGVLSATGRSIQVRAPDGVVREYRDLLQTDAAINQGNSGGALLDITGRLIGINNAMSAGAENIGFAIPMDVVRKEFQRQLLQSTSFVASGSAPWLGLEVADRDGQVVVSEIVTGGPAQIAGVRVGDVLSRIGEHEVRTSIDYLRHFFDLAQARTVPLTVERLGRPLRLVAQPIARADGAILTGLGVRIDEVDVEENQRLVRAATYAFYRGSGLRRVALFPAALRLAEVLPDSPAARTGLEKGDLLLGLVVQGRFGERELPLHSRLDLARLCQENRGAELRFIILRGERDLVGTVKLNGGTARER